MIYYLPKGGEQPLKTSRSLSNVNALLPWVSPVCGNRTLSRYTFCLAKCISRCVLVNARPRRQSAQGLTPDQENAGMPELPSDQLQRPPILAKGGIIIPGAEPSGASQNVGIPHDRFDQNLIDEICSQIDNNCEQVSEEPYKKVNLKPAATGLSLVEMEQVCKELETQLESRAAYNRHLNGYAESYRLRFKAMRKDFNLKLNQVKQSSRNSEGGS
jgi:hypothetical protein